MLFKLNVAIFLCIFNFLTFIKQSEAVGAKIWGPGLSPDKIIMPARYFFVKLDNFSNESKQEIEAKLEGSTSSGRPCRIWTNILNRKDGSYIVRYKVYDSCQDLKISISYNGNHLEASPYIIKQKIYPDECDCTPYKNLEEFSEKWECGVVPEQLINDLSRFESINWDELREQIIKKYDKPHAVSLCHYIIKNNIIFRKCYGQYVGFKVFMDNVLLSLARKAKIPDLEFFVNLGDWPLVPKNDDKFPIFSWCGSTDTVDIVMPTYDITESTLENMGRVMLDTLSVQGNVKDIWENRIPKAFWRGRDSDRARLKLVDISREHPDLFNVSLTNFFFFRSEEETYGPKTDHVSFYSFFDYKYQIGIDGTVAAYRFPYLLGGGSLIFKQDSKYYEHFYNMLKPNEHYIPIKKDLSDLVKNLKWAIQNDEEAQVIGKNGQTFLNEHLLPKNIFCYYAQLLHEFSKKITSTVSVFDDMEIVVGQKKTENCDCKINTPKKYDEL